MTEILAKYRTHRKGSVRLVVVHVNDGPDTHGGAVGCAEFCQLPKSKRHPPSKGGYHELVDDVQFIIGGHVDDVVNGAAGGNADGYHICLIGLAKQTDAEWHDAFSTAVGLNGAVRVRNACLMLGVPMQLLTTAQVKAGESGICGHVNVAEAFKKSDHTDPGPHFPWAEFMQTVTDGEDMPLNDADKKFISDTVLSILRSEGISGNAQTAAVDSKKILKKLGAR
jgi:hypothetical protein